MSTPVATPRTNAQLGMRISEHPQSVVGSRGRMIQTYVALGIGGVFLLAGLIAFFVMGEAAGLNALFCFGFGGLCVLGIGVLGFFDARNTRDMSLSLYERGLDYADKAGRKIWLWEDIDAITHHQVANQQTRIIHHSYKLTNQNGDTLLFYDHIRDLAAAIETIRQKVYPLLLPKLEAAFANGTPVPFGAITIGQAGLQIKGKTVAWSEIAAVTTLGGTVVVERPGGGWFNDLELSLGDVANPELLFQLIARRLGR